MRTLRRTLTWGRCPQTPGIFRFSARMDLFWGAGCARPRPIPAAESALGLRSRSALSSTQVLPEWTTSTSPCNNLLSNGDNPLNSLSHSKGSLQICVPATECPRISAQLLAEEQEKGDETFRREYMCEFGVMEGAVFSRESIDAALQDFEPLYL